MRLFCACTRWAFNRLQEGQPRLALKKQAQGLFGLNSRYCDDAILKAGEVLDSRRVLLNAESKETDARLARAKRKLKSAEKDLAAALRTGEAKKIAKAKLTVQGRKARAEKLARKLAELKNHQTGGTIPKVVFGGRALWRQVCKGRATREEWQAARGDRLYARGDKSKSGNPNIKIAYHSTGFTLGATVSHLSFQTGTDSLGRPVMGKAPRIEGLLWLPEKHRAAVQQALLNGTPYTVELIRGKDHRYRAHLSFMAALPATKTSPGHGYLGIDTNPDGAALANVDHTGQPEPWPKGFAVPYPQALSKFSGEFQVTLHPNGFLSVRMPELAYSRGERRDYLSGVLAKAVVDIAGLLGKPLAVENLYFSKDRLDSNKKFNRMAANFPYQKMIEAIIRKARKEGVGIKPVWPAHTSTIGYYKYMERYGITVHQAAACVIGRRAMGFRERLTKELKQKIQAVKEKLNRKANSLPGEGTGMTRKVGRLFKRLDGKVPLHNGQTRYRQGHLSSVWQDLKQLARSSR
jgi:IS605 OrfB family transposase